MMNRQEDLAGLTVSGEEKGKAWGGVGVLNPISDSPYIFL